MVEEIALFDQINNHKPSDPFASVSETVEKPIVVAVGIQIILDKQVVLRLFFAAHVSSTNVTAFKVRIDIISINSKRRFLLLFQLFIALPVVIDQRVDSFVPPLKGFAVSAVGLQLIVDAFELTFEKVLIQWQILAVCQFKLQFPLGSFLSRDTFLNTRSIEDVLEPIKRPFKEVGPGCQILRPTCGPQLVSR